MSEQIQRRARDRRDAALRREKNARERAARSRERGEGLLARRHDRAADIQAAAAEAAEQVRLADVSKEGDRLGGDDARPAGCRAARSLRKERS